MKNRKTALDKSKMKLCMDAVIKHRRRLAGTGFECCAPCPGCPGKVEDVGAGLLMMRCMRAGAEGIRITAEQAQACDGSRPTQLRPPSKNFIPLRAA